MAHLAYKPSYRRNLPHIQPAGATFFLTFRLAGSLPKSVVAEWNHERAWLKQLALNNPMHYAMVRVDFDRFWFKKFESILDETSIGPLWLKNERVAALIAESLHYRDDKKYRLDAFTIMPNHVHLVMKPLPRNNLTSGTDASSRNVEYHSLASIMQSLKGYTAFQANQILGQSGEFWAHESYDHWIRDHSEWQRTIAYVLNNPLKAGYVRDWKDWKWSYRRNEP